MKKTLRLAGSMLAASLFATSMAYAESMPAPPPPAKAVHGKMMHVDSIIQQLHLTPKQDKAYQAMRTRLKQARRQLKKQMKLAKTNIQNVVNTEIKSENPNIEHVMAAKKAFKPALDHFRLISERESIKFFNQLTPQQKKLFLQKMSEHALTKDHKLSEHGMRMKHHTPPPPPMPSTDD